MTETNRSPLRAIVIVTLIVLVAMAILIYSSVIALRIANQSAPLIDAAMEVKYELSLFHLWTEELVQQDPTVDREQVWQHLNQARWYANAMLQGGENSEGRFHALDDPALRSMIHTTLDQMDRFEAVGLERIERARNSLAGSDKDQAFDYIFSVILDTADEVETMVQRNMAAQVRQFERLVTILGVVVILVGLAGGTLFFLFERRRKSDYTSLLESREQLQREQALLRSLIDSIPDLIFFKDRGSVYLGCNKAVEEFTGRVESEIIGITDLELFNPELGAFFLEQDQKMLAEGKVRRNEEWVAYPDGRKVLLDTLKTPYYGPDGGVLGLIGVSRDITERHRADESLGKSQASLSEAQRLAHIGSWEHDLQTDEVWWSDEIFRIFEIDQDKFCATYQGFLDVIHPEDREQVKRAYAESVRDRRPYDVVHRLSMSNGRIKYVHERGETFYSETGAALRSMGTVQDITEGHQTQAALRASEQRLALILNTLPYGVQENDTEGVITYSNIAHHRILGWHPGELIGRHIWESQTNSKYQQELRDYLAFLITEQPPPQPYITVNVTKDGRELMLEITWDYQRNAAGTATGFISVISDITKRAQAEHRLRDSETRYRELVNAMSDGVAVYDVVGDGEDFIFKEHNRAGARITGMPREQVIGKPVRQAFPGMEEMGLFDVFQRVWRNGKPEHHPVSHYRDNELTLWVENYVFKLPGGEIVAVYEDITERRQAEQVLRESEQRLRTVVEQMPVILDAIDEQGNIQIWNSEAEKVSGYSASEMVGNPKAWELLYPDAKYREAMLADWRGQGDHRSWEWRLQTKDGSERFVEWSNISGQFPIPGWSSWGLGVDVTERKRAEEAISSLNRKLEDRVRERTNELQAVNEELTSFSYSVSHDLRAPLRAIDGFSLALMEDYGEQLDAVAIDYLQRVRGGAQRMGILIDDMLHLSRVNRSELSMHEVDLSKIAESVLEELRAGEPDRKVELTLGHDMWAQGDPRMLRAMLDNLLGNAWKFTSREAISLITFKRRTDNPQMFYISDNGVGFDMRHADKLFGAFQRLHRISDFPGTGIGLATVQRIVHRHGGRIWAEAREGEGATFYFLLGPTGVSQIESTIRQGEKLDGTEELTAGRG